MFKEALILDNDNTIIKNEYKKFLIEKERYYNAKKGLDLLS